jgi:ubiquinone/menaquinone biosynthesis C-methylase UbiE
MFDGPYAALNEGASQEIDRRNNWLAGISQDSIANELSAAGISPCARMLDIGSGIGRRAAMSAQYLSQGFVHGLERDLALVGYATRSAHAAGIHNISFQQGDARELPYAANYFDAIRIDSVLWAVPNPEKVIAESKRVLKPGGLLLVRNFDMQGLLSFSSPHLPKSVYTLLKAFRAAIRSWGGDPDVGHQICPLLIQNGFNIETATAFTDIKLGVASPEERTSFWEFFEQWRDVVIEEGWLDQKMYDQGRRAYEVWVNNKARQQTRTVFFVVARRPPLT